MNIKRPLCILLAVAFARTTVAAPLATTDSGTTTGDICVMNPDGSLGINPNLDGNVPSVVTSELSTLQQSLNSVEQSMHQAAFELFESTVTDPNSPTIGDLIAQLKNAQAQVNNLVAIENSYGMPNNDPSAITTPAKMAVVRAIVETYVEIATQYLSILVYQYPSYFKSFQDVQSLVSFQLPVNLWVELNLGKPLSLVEIVGMTPSTVDVSLTPEKIYDIFSTEAARSEILRAKGTADFEATRCAVSNALITQYFTQEIDRGVSPTNIQLPVTPSTPACLGLSIGELERFYRSQDAQPSEGALEQQLINNSLSLSQVLPPQMKTFLQTYHVDVPSVALMVISPYWAPEVNSKLTQNDAPKVQGWLEDAVAKAERIAPYYAPLMTMTASPQFTHIIQNLFKSCALNLFMPHLTQEQARAQLMNNLALAEKAIGLQISNFSALYAGHLENLNADELRTALTQMLIYKKYLDAKIIIEDLYRSEQNDQNASIAKEEVEGALDASLYQLATQTVEHALTYPSVQDWLNGIVAQVMKLKTATVGSQPVQPQSVVPFYNKTIALADVAAKWFNPKTPYDQIPFQPKFMGATQQGLLNELTGKNYADFKVLSKQVSDNGLKDVWNVISQRLTERAKKYGGCSFSRIDTIKNATLGMAESVVGKKSNIQLNFSQQCAIMRNNADIMGLNLPQIPLTLDGILPVLRSKMSPKAVDTTIQNYKMLLIENQIQGNRFLMFRDSQNQADKKAPYLFQAIGQSNNVPYMVNTIEWALQFSDAQLAKEMKTYLPAKNLQDYNHLLLASDGLPTMLNADPAIQTALYARQHHLTRASGIDREIYDSSMNDLTVLFFAIYGGSFLQGRLGKGLVSTTKVGLRFSTLTKNLFGPIGFYAQAAADWVIQFARISTDNAVNLANVNEIYWSQALNVSPNSTFSSTFISDGSRSQAVANIESAISTSHRREWMDAFQIVAIAGSIGAARLYGLTGNGATPSWLYGTTGWRTKQLENALVSGDRAAINNAERGIQKMVLRDQKRVNGSLKVLGYGSNQDLPTLSDLQDHLRAIRLSPASTSNQIYNAELAYQRIVSVVGRRAELMTNQDRALEIYARAAFGSNGTPQDLWNIHSEYARLILEGGTP